MGAVLRDNTIRNQDIVNIKIFTSKVKDELNILTGTDESQKTSTVQIMEIKR